MPGVELLNVLIGQGQQSLVTLVIDLVRNLTHLGSSCRIGDDSYLALVNNRVELALNLCVKNFTEVLCTETGCKCVLLHGYGSYHADQYA